MIVNLDEPLYIIDNRTHAHKIIYIDVATKIIYTEFNNAYDTDEDEIYVNIVQDNMTVKSVKARAFKYGTSDLTVTTKEVNLSDDMGNITYLVDENI